MPSSARPPLNSTANSHPRFACGKVRGRGMTQRARGHTEVCPGLSDSHSLSQRLPALYEFVFAFSSRKPCISVYSLSTSRRRSYTGERKLLSSNHSFSKRF